MSKVRECVEWGFGKIVNLHGPFLILKESANVFVAYFNLLHCYGIYYELSDNLVWRANVSVLRVCTTIIGRIFSLKCTLKNKKVKFSIRTIPVKINFL
jgi:fumarate reductase subunit C